MTSASGDGRDNVNDRARRKRRRQIALAFAVDEDIDVLSDLRAGRLKEPVGDPRPARVEVAHELTQRS